MFRNRRKNTHVERKAYEGSSKNRVYSYSAITNKRSSSVDAQKTKRRLKIPLYQLFLRWIVVISALVVIVFILIASNTPIIRIASDEVPISTTTEYGSTATSLIKSSVLNRTKLTFDYLGFELKMKERHPEIASVDTSFALVGSKPVVRLSFYSPVLRVLSNGKSWLVDSRGVAIATTRDIDNKLAQITDEIGVAKELGDAVISGDDVEFILTISRVAKEKGINIDKYTTPIIPKQLDVRVVGEQYYTKFNLNEDPKEQVGAWLIAREKLTSLGQTPVEYIDLRASEKVYWK